MQRAIGDIFQKSTSQLSFEELYRNAYILVLHKYGEKLYNHVQDVIRSRLKEETVPAIYKNYDASLLGNALLDIRKNDSYSTSWSRSLEAAHRFLSSLVNSWKDHIVSMQMISSVLKYLDKVYSKSADKVPVNENGIYIFREVVLLNSFEIGEKCVETILILVYLERKGNTINRPLINDCLDMLNSLPSENKKETLYDVLFAPKFLSYTRNFYEIESSTVIGVFGVVEYLKKAEKRFEEEKERSKNYLFTKIASPLLSVVEDELLSKHLDDLLENQSTGFFSMIDSSNFEGLQLVYESFSRVELGVKSLKKYLAKYVAHHGKLINETTSQALEGKMAVGRLSSNATMATLWVQKVLALWDRLNTIISTTMDADRSILNSLSDAFVTFVDGYTRAPEYISLFIDDNLKKDARKAIEGSIEATLQNSVTLFRFISEKDVFEKYYKTHLAKRYALIVFTVFNTFRLLNNRSISSDAELGMISRLKQEAGNVFTQKLEGMFNGKYSDFSKFFCVPLLMLRYESFTGIVTRVQT